MMQEPTNQPPRHCPRCDRWTVNSQSRICQKCGQDRSARLWILIGTIAAILMIAGIAFVAWCAQTPI